MYRIFVLIMAAAAQAVAQGDLMKELDVTQEASENIVTSTFKGTRLINGHSIETRGKGVLDVLIGHRFGRLNSGSYNLFGLDDAQVRLGVDYGVTDRLNVGIGRSSFEKTYDGFLKYRVLRQQSGGDRPVPISITAFASTSVKTLKPFDPALPDDFSSKLSYTAQVMIAKKFSPALSFQITPSLVHVNSVVQSESKNDVYALGVGGRMKLTKRLSLNAEYFYQLEESLVFENALAIGFDIETGGHVFQLHFTNSRAMIEKGFITETTGKFFKGDVHFGFNISRTFQLKERR